MSIKVPPKRCVIADDTRASRELVARWLRGCEFQCELATNGRQALQLVQATPPDLVVTDLEMPELCGLELLKQMRCDKDKRLRELPILVITSLCDGQTRDIVKSLGGNGLLHKPLDRQSTLSTVLNLVAGQKALECIITPDAEPFVEKVGMISPTLRRLISSVASCPRKAQNR